MSERDASNAPSTFESDEELEEFLAFTYAERHRDVDLPSAVDPASWTPTWPRGCTGTLLPGRSPHA
jgi:hypothetical protein